MHFWSSMGSINLMKKYVFIIFLLIIGSQVYSDEVSKMSIIDGDLNELRVEDFNFERLESDDKTSIIISSSKNANVSCSLFDKNNRPVTTIESEIKPPKTEIVTKSQNLMVTSVKCLEVRNDYERRDSKLMEMYYKLPTFLLDNI